MLILAAPMRHDPDLLFAQLSCALQYLIVFMLENVDMQHLHTEFW